MAFDLAPPCEATFESFPSLMNHLQDHGKEHGYTVVIQRSKKGKGKDNEVKIYYLQCAKSGKPRDRLKGHRLKAFTSQKTDCPFRCRAKQVNGHWELLVDDPTHNHSAIEPVAYHQNRTLPPIMQQEVFSMTTAGAAPKQIATALRQLDSEQLFTMQDIYNVRRTFRIEQLHGRSPIEAMLHELKSSNYYHTYQLNRQQKITHLFFSHPKSIKLLQRYPEVLLMDCTYKTNRFRLPLLDIIGSTGLNSSFYAAFVFLSGETEVDYGWAIDQLKIMLEKHNIKEPGVIVTDKDQALLNIIQTQLKNTANLFCNWHIRKNVLSYASRL